MNLHTSLPIESLIPDVKRTLSENSSAALQAPPGTGKTTLVPLALLQEPWLRGQRILILEPRRIAGKRLERLLRDASLGSQVRISPLYGDLPQEEQDQAIRPSPGGLRKVVLATTIAETSLTIEGIRTVVDTGLMRVPAFDPPSGMTRLKTVRVSRASAEQRCGRAGRLGPGICCRLWTGETQRHLADRSVPEILASDLAPLALDLAAWGVTDPGRLRWIDPPPASAFSQATDLLAQLGALHKNKHITQHGRLMSGLPLHPRLSHMILKAQELGLGALACDLAAILSERDILKDSQGSKEADLRERVEIVRTLEQGTRMLSPGTIVDIAGCLRIIRTASRWKRQLGIGHEGSREDVQKTGPLLGFAYPDRMARRRPEIGNRYLLSNGRGAFFSEGDPLVVYEYIAAAHLDGGDREARIFLAAPLFPEDLEGYFSESMEWVEFISWGRREQAVVSRKQLRLGRLVLKDEPLHHPDPSRVADALIDGIRQMGANALPWTKELRNRQARILFLRRVGMKDWPDVSDEALLENLEEVLGPYLVGMTGSRDLQRLDLRGAFRALLGYDHQRALEELAPTHVTVPSGSRIPIRYSASENPVLAVRLQEMFGALETPSVAGGKIRLTLHLLSPAGRPVQVTDDLSSFWSGAYYDVKKGLKGRYPRHHWPENPLEALPTKKVKPQVGRKLLVATVNPLEFYALDDLRFVTQMPIEIAVAPQREILRAIEKYYPKPGLEKGLDLGPGLEDEIEFIHQEEGEEDNPNLQDLRDLSSLPPIVRFVNKIFGDAIHAKASDIHIEPQKASVLLRYRVDGVMREIMKTDRHVHAPLVSRIKVISNMDISVRRRPQDGRSQVRFGNRNYDLRVSSIPTSYGEKITIRILDQAGAARRLEDLTLSEKDFEAFEKALSRPQGVILVTGPTGSGKSSTLYACLNRLNSPRVNIFTVEDPVEFDIQGVNQVQVHPQAGITFAVGLRSILRQDPDIVMVGEIRDSETAAIAFQAGQTGHLVLSTLHTNDAPSSVTRLLDLGVQPFIVSDSLIAVIEQRLVRKICPRCKSPDELSLKLLRQVIPSLAQGEKTFWKGKGCDACQYTGYAGRLPVFEILSATPTLKEVLSSNISATALQRIAGRQGYEPMVVDGIRKAAQGLTTVEEVFRVTSPEALDTGPSTSGAVFPEEPIGNDEGSQTPSIHFVGSVQPKRILLAEDNEVTAKLIGNYLEAENYLVTKVRTGIEALKLAFQQKPDLIITDLMMPELDGFGLINKLRSQLMTRYIPILVITAKSDSDSEVTAIQEGADDYIVKPVDPKRLLARVDKLIRKRISN